MRVLYRFFCSVFKSLFKVLSRSGFWYSFLPSLFIKLGLLLPERRPVVAEDTENALAGSSVFRLLPFTLYDLIRKKGPSSPHH